MSNFSQTLTSGRWVRRVRLSGGTLLAGLLAWQDRWRQRYDLEALDDEQLADIGLTRGEVRRRGRSRRG